MSQETGQSAAREALEVVRALRHHLMWQQSQGWSGVPTGDAANWRPAPLKALLAPAAPASPRAGRPGPAAPAGRSAPPQPGAPGETDWREKMRSFSQAQTPPPPSRNDDRATQAHEPAGLYEPEPQTKPSTPPPPLIPEGPLEIGPISRATPVSLRPPVSLDEEGRLFTRLGRLQSHIGACTRCELHGSRHHIMHGAGPARTRLMLIVPQPNTTEDERGEAFVGASGKLLAAMLSSIGAKPEDVHIVYQNRCRTPNDLPPKMEHIRACFPFLIQQIRVVQPELVLAMGAAVAQTLLQTTTRLEKLRKQWYPLHEREVLPNARRSCHMLVTYHPFYLLKRPLRKQEAWQDMRMIRERLLALEEDQGEGVTL